jgi:hypothetical protein
MVREFPALVSFPAPVLRLFSPPFFAAPQTPSRTQGLGLLHIHLVLRGLPSAAFPFLRRQNPDFTKPTAR